MHLNCDVVKDLLDVDVILCTGLNEVSPYFVSHSLPLTLLDSSFTLKVALGSSYGYNDALICKISNILKPSVEVIERTTVIDGICLGKETSTRRTAYAPW